VNRLCCHRKLLIEYLKVNLLLLYILNLVLRKLLAVSHLLMQILMK